MNGDVIFGGRLSAIVIFLVSITNCTAKTKSTSNPVELSFMIQLSRVLLAGIFVRDDEKVHNIQNRVLLAGRHVPPRWWKVKFICIQKVKTGFSTMLCSGCLLRGIGDMIVNVWSERYNYGWRKFNNSELINERNRQSCQYSWRCIYSQSSTQGM